MKRSIFLLIPLVLGLASCGGSKIPNQEVVDRVKEILNKQDFSPFYSKSLSTIYTHEFNVLEIEEEDDDKITNYFNYAGFGNFDYYYQLSEENYNSLIDDKGIINTFDALSKGDGWYRLTQEGRTNTTKRVNWYDAETNILNTVQMLTLSMTEDNALIFNALGAGSKEDFYDFDETQYLSASISKSLLFGSISTRSFRDIFSQVDLFNAPGNMEHIDMLYYSICHDLLSKNDKEISDFIIKNQISIEEPTEEDEDIKLSFTYTNEDLDDEKIEYIFAGAIQGTLMIDSETLAVKNFSYEMNSTIVTQDEEIGSARFVNSRFTCLGISHRDPYGEAQIPEDPTVYTDVAEFLEDVSKQVIPPNIYL